MRLKNNNRGVALLLSIIVMMVLFILGSTYLGTITSEIGIAKNHINSVKAFYLADSGIQRGIRYLIDNPDISLMPWSMTEFLGEGEFTVQAYFDTTEGVVIIKSTGRVNNASRILQIKIDITPWEYALFADVDINAATAYGTIDGKVHANNLAMMGGLSITGLITQGGLGEGLVIMPLVDMEYYENIATDIYIGDLIVKNHLNAGILYVKAGNGGTGLVTLDTTGVKGGSGLNINNCVIIAEGGINIIGNKRLKGFRDSGYPLFITKTGDIIDSGSGSDKKLRQIDGILYSEQGKIRFESIEQQGCIVAKNIELVNNISITYKPKYVPNPPPGFTGGIRIYDWEEKYY